MVRRSVLFTPGDRPEMLRKAPSAGADTIIFDLEDAVAPQRKAEARDAVRSVLSDPEFDPACEVCVRVNATAEEQTADLEGMLGTEATAELDGDTRTDATADETPRTADETLRLDSLLLPKAETASDVREFVSQLDAFDAELPVLALIENASGVLAAPEIAAVPETDALVFGAEDLSADLGATRTKEGTEVLYARERVVLAAAANDCTAIDTVFTDFGDEDGLIEETEFAIRLGYDGKLAIHPTQVEPINEAFTPTADELAWAKTVLEAKREADAEGRGVFEVDGEMIDAPLIAQAERLVSRANAADDQHADHLDGS